MLPEQQTMNNNKHILFYTILELLNGYVSKINHNIYTQTVNTTGKNNKYQQQKIQQILCVVFNLLFKQLKFSYIIKRYTILFVKASNK